MRGVFRQAGSRVQQPNETQIYVSFNSTQALLMELASYYNKSLSVECRESQVQIHVTFDITQSTCIYNTGAHRNTCKSLSVCLLLTVKLIANLWEVQKNF